MNHLHKFYGPDTQVPEKYECDINKDKLLEPSELPKTQAAKF